MEGHMPVMVQGYFESGRFIADTPIQIPEGRKTIVTVLDEEADRESARVKYIAYWDKIIEDIQNSDEALEGEPERMRFKTFDGTDGL
jgi:hypothetical protein